MNQNIIKNGKITNSESESDIENKQVSNPPQQRRGR